MTDTTTTGAEDTAADLTISHTAAEGTTLAGDPRPHHGVLKANGWRWARAGAFWYVPRSRDAAPQWARIHRTAADLAAVGLTVAVEVDEGRRSVAEIEEDRRREMAGRAERLAGAAERTAETAAELEARARQMADVIPLGQPILVGHYSEGRDRRYRDKIGRTFDKAHEADTAARDLARAAKASAAHQSHREDVGTTRRRLERLEAEARRIARALEPCRASGKTLTSLVEGTLTCPVCYHDVAVTDGTVPRHGDGSEHPEHRAQQIDRAERLAEEIDYWREHVAAAEANGAKVWTRADVEPGDIVNGQKVRRVNAKSVTVETGYSWTNTVRYEEIRTHRRPESVAEPVAEVAETTGQEVATLF